MEAAQLLGREREGWVLCGGFRGQEESLERTSKLALPALAHLLSCYVAAPSQRLNCEMWDGLARRHGLSDNGKQESGQVNCREEKPAARELLSAGECQQDERLSLSLADFITASPWKGILPIRITTGWYLPSRKILSCTCSVGEFSGTNCKTVFSRQWPHHLRTQAPCLLRTNHGHCVCAARKNLVHTLELLVEV